MKKLLPLIAGLVVTANASAVGIDPDLNGVNQGTTVDVSAGDCALLTETVTLNLSSGVAGGYVCNTGTNVIGVATCHPNGRKPDDTNNYIYVGSSNGGSVNAPATPDLPCSSGNASTKANGVTSAGS